MQLSATQLDDIEFIFNHDERVITYSGRSMYGKNCFAIVTSNPYNTIAALVRQLIAYSDPRTQELADALVDQDIRADELGQGTVIYWPGITLPDNYIVADDSKLEV